MAAMLERNGKDGKATPSNIPQRELIHCPLSGCETSYTLSFTDNEFRMAGSENNMEKMRRTAVAPIKKEHPEHSTRIFLWKTIGVGPECSWYEADSRAVRAAS